MYSPTNYYNPYAPIYQGMPQMTQMPSYPTQPNSQMAAPQPPQVQSLNGKIVDSEDILKVTEIPMGGYGIFPKADFKEIYLKYWKDNGTTEILTFKPTEQKICMTEQEQAIKTILEKIDSMEQKINILFGRTETQPAPTSVPVQIQSQPQPERKEVNLNEY